MAGERSVRYDRSAQFMSSEPWTRVDAIVMLLCRWKRAVLRWAPWILAMGLALVTVGERRAHSPAQSTAAPEELRPLWQRAPDGYIRQWRVLGEFPNPERSGLDIDYLAAVGGEAGVRPRAGMRVARAGRPDAVWTEYRSSSDVIDLSQAMVGRSVTDAVGYAYTTIESARDQAVFLSLGSDDGVRVWLNGRALFRKVAERSVLPDSDLVAATLVPGSNHLLVKVEQGVGDWGLILRVLSPLAAAAVASEELAPSLETASNETSALVLHTDTDSPAHAWATPVRIEVRAAGGRLVLARSAARGDTVRLDTRAWSQGAYEVAVSSAAADGGKLRAVLPWYKGDLSAAARALIARAPSAFAGTPAAMTVTLLAAMAQDRLLGPPRERGPLADDDRRRALASILMEYEELQQAVRGGSGQIRAGGFVRLAYRDEIDDSPQFCRAYLPANFDHARRWPLVVSLHGYYPENPPYMRWWRVDQRHVPLVDRHGVILIEPHGRGNANYTGIGERDVLRCIELAKQQLAVDPDRVYLTGYSMGGGGAWQLASHRPELFAAIGPINGGWDYHVLLPQAARAQLSPRERFYQERSSSFAQAESLLSVPVFVDHAELDESVDVKQSRYAVSLLQRWGYQVRYHERPGMGHTSAVDGDALVRWFLQHRREAHPRKVRIRAADLKTASAYWVRIEQRQDAHVMMRAEAEVIGPNRVRLDTENVLAVTLAPGAALVDANQPLEVAWNGGDTRVVDLREGRATLLAPGYRPSALSKTPTLAGPLSDIETTPFAIVIGTLSADPLMRQLCARKARMIADYWQRWQHHPPRVLKDTAISDGDVARYSLMLIGGADANRVTQRLSRELPLSVTPGEIALAGRSFAVKDAYVSIIYPHPLNAERYVMVVAATSAAGLSFFDGLDGETRNFDFCIDDGVIADPLHGRPINKVRIAAGWFGQDWQLVDDLVETADPAVRARCQFRTFSPGAGESGEGGIALDAATLDGYAGRYQVGNDMTASLTRVGGKLVAEVPFQPAFTLSARSETEFVVVGTPLRVTFLRDATGAVTGARVQQPGQWDVVVKRVPQ
jgi:dienelactone hydrolase